MGSGSLLFVTSAANVDGMARLVLQLEDPGAGGLTAVESAA